MAKRTCGSAATDADLSPVEHVCRVCGTVGVVAVLAQPGDGGPPLALCVACAQDRQALRGLVDALNAHRITIARPRVASDAA